MLKSKMYSLLSTRHLVKVVGQRGKVSSQRGSGSGKTLNMMGKQERAVSKAQGGGNFLWWSLRVQ